MIGSVKRVACWDVVLSHLSHRQQGQIPNELNTLFHYTAILKYQHIWTYHIKKVISFKNTFISDRRQAVDFNRIYED